MTNRTLSAIDLQVMWNRLLAVVEEQGQVLIRTAFSPIVRECGDISAGIFDLQGRMLAQAVTGTPGHINTMAESVAKIFETFPVEEMNPGNVFLTNDPWIGSGHLNDFLVVQPAFLNDKIVGLSACTSHLIDLGGRGMGPNGSDVHEEGLFLPPVKLADRGEVNSMLIDIIRANAREPIQNEGDTYALMACCDVGCARLVDMMREFGISDCDQLSDHIIDTSLKAAGDAISEVPNGEYFYDLMLDGYDFEVELKAKLTVSDREMLLDMTGSSPCSKFGINVPLNYATAYAVFGIRCIVGSDMPNNAGSLAPFKVTAPEGSIVNPPFPAPVAMRHTIGQLMPDLAFGCLTQALPDKVPAEGASCMYDIPMRNLPNMGDRNNATEFAVELTHNGGTGARPTKDGLSATAYPSGVWGSQVEITESVAPLIIHRRELKPDTGGAGTYRGGLGQTLEVENAEGAPTALFLSFERVKYPARGRAGGCDGSCGHISFTTGEVLSGKGEFEIPPGERLIMHTPGGGGFGDPKKRTREAIELDLRRGYITAKQAAEIYGYSPA